MLVLSRKVGESIFIGADAGIRIEVTRINSGQVQIGVTAPKETPVHREEVYHQMYRSDDVDEQPKLRGVAEQSPRLP